MKKGKKDGVIKLLKIIKKELKRKRFNSDIIIIKTLENLELQLAIKLKRVGRYSKKINYLIPQHKEKLLSIKFFVKSILNRKEKFLKNRIINEIIETYNLKETASIKKKK